MPPRRKKGKGRPRRSPSRKPGRGGTLRVRGGLAVLLLLIWFAGGILHQFLLRRGRAHHLTSGHIYSSTIKLTPTFEIFPDEPEPAAPEPSKPESPVSIPPAVQEPVPKPHQTHRPRIAIVIDDLGYDFQLAQKFIQLDRSISLAILPHTPFQKKISSIAQKEGMETLLHLPMEPMEYPRISPGEGALLTHMSLGELSAVLVEDLDFVPGVRGVNNHMGSRFTTLPAPLKTVFLELKERNLFFLDSRTTPDTRAESVAKEVGLPFVRRNIFLDHIASAEFTREQLAKLLSIAQRDGTAIGIGHPIDSTYAELAKALPALKHQAAIVPVSQLIRPGPE